MILIIICSCGKEEEIITEIEEELAYTTCGLSILNCEPENFIPDTTNVKKIDVSECHVDGGANDLNPDSRKYLWFYCSEVSELIYEDSIGNEISLKIQNRKHFKRNSTFVTSTNQCSTHYTESVNEVMEIELSNMEIDIKLKLELEQGQRGDNTFDGLRIRKANFTDVNSSGRQVLFMFLNNQNSRVSHVVSYIWSLNLTIQNQIYNDVHYSDGRFQTPMEIYYNQECGLIAFVDDNNVFWKFKGFK